MSTLDRSAGPQARTAPASSHPIVEDIAHDPEVIHHPRRERHLTPVNLVLVLTAVGIAAVGQVLLRHGMRVAKEATVGGGSLALQAVSSPYVLGGLAVFAISAVLWLAALARVPLSIAYPFNALGYLGILTASAVVLHERVAVRTWVGSAFVVAGLIMVVSSANSH